MRDAEILAHRELLKTFRAVASRTFQAFAFGGIKALSREVIENQRNLIERKAQIALELDDLRLRREALIREMQLLGAQCVHLTPEGTLALRGGSNTTCWVCPYCPEVR